MQILFKHHNVTGINEMLPDTLWCLLVFEDIIEKKL